MPRIFTASLLAIFAIGCGPQIPYGAIPLPPRLVFGPAWRTPAGAVAIAIEVADPNDFPSDVLIVAVSGSCSAPLTLAAGGDGTIGLTALERGTAHVVLWDAAHDLPGACNLSDSAPITLRATPRSLMTGTPVTQTFTIAQLPVKTGP